VHIFQLRICIATPNNGQQQRTYYEYVFMYL